MTLVEMNRALVTIADECRAIIPDLKGRDAQVVAEMLEEIAQHVVTARTLVVRLIQGKAS